MTNRMMDKKNTFIPLMGGKGKIGVRSSFLTDYKFSNQTLENRLFKAARVYTDKICLKRLISSK
jgi:hypothetical protein